MEFAIFGSLFLVALAFLIQIGLQMNYQQEIEQQTFRRALSAAQQEGEEESQSTTYYHVRDRQLPNPSDGFAILPRMRTEGASTVAWGEFLTFLDDGRDSQPRTIVDLNGQDVKWVRAEDLKQLQQNSTAECSAYYYDCVKSCDVEDEDYADCTEACAKKENDECASMPLVRHIDTRLTSSGTITQKHTAGSQTDTSLTSSSTEDTTMYLNVRDTDKVRDKGLETYNSALTTSVTRSGADWTVDNE